MNIVIILRLKKAFARPSLQENRSQPEVATVSCATSATNIPKKEVQGFNTGEKAETFPKKVSRAMTRTSLHTIHEEISTVSQVTNDWERKAIITFSGCHQETGEWERQEAETKEERGEDDEVADHHHDQLHLAHQPQLHLRHHRLQLQQGEHRGVNGEPGDQPQDGDRPLQPSPLMQLLPQFLPLLLCQQVTCQRVIEVRGPPAPDLNVGALRPP